jgi:septal ring factor EnvC (AmiA/AmiB activator)
MTNPLTNPRALALMLAVLVSVPAAAQIKKPGFLSEEEEDKLREAQDPSARIQLYLDFEEARLTRFETFRSQPLDPQYDNGAFLAGLLEQVIGLNDELKDWVADQYDRNSDMRKGLRALLDLGPKRLEQMRRIQQAPDSLTPNYADNLRDAIDDLSDTLDGAAKALGDQQKKFAAEKREEKAEVQESKVRAKEEKKRTKEEKKLRKKEHKSGVPADEDQN